jgi:host factor-I protein
VRGFDKYCVVFETNHQEQLIFKHAISTVVTNRRPGTSRPEVADDPQPSEVAAEPHAPDATD